MTTPIEVPEWLREEVFAGITSKEQVFRLMRYRALCNYWAYRAEQKELEAQYYGFSTWAEFKEEVRTG